MRSVLQHLRFPFSVLLMPVFLFAYSDALRHPMNHATVSIILLFFVLHILVYPSSNAYNSLQDQDTGSIGLVKNPLPPSPQLGWITVLMDILAVTLSLFINLSTALGIGIYILFSRLYSNRKIRIKQYPISGFLTIFIFQGMGIYYIVHLALSYAIEEISVTSSLVAGCLIGAMYPLSQIYQHEQDKLDGVTTLSYLLGYKGTFIFASILFMLGSGIFTVHNYNGQDLNVIVIYSVFQAPIILYFLYWFWQVVKDVKQANYQHTMYMNIIAAVCMIACFVCIILFYRFPAALC